MTLMSVLILGSVGAAVAVTLIVVGLSASKGSFLRMQSSQAKMIVGSCAEEAFAQIRASSTFTGTGSFASGSSTCVYAITNTGGTTRRIAATSTVGTVIRKLDISISTMNPTILISNWQEVP